MARALTASLFVVLFFVGLAAPAVALRAMAGEQAPAPGAGAQVPGRGGAAGGRGPVRDNVGQQQAAGTGIIRGRIVTGDTGTPIRRAQVRAASGGRGGRLAVTDSEGRFEFRDLPQGRWDLTASKAGFVTMRYGQRRPFEQGTPIELANAQVLERADFILPRGAAINGRVFDEFGDPVAGARLQVLRYQVVQGTRRLVPMGVTAQSDDTGAFRLFGLMPGDYYVSGSLRALQVDDPDDVTAYAATYYPGTSNPTEAQRIPLAVAEETSISFGLTPVRTAAISGRVIGSNGNALSGGTLMLIGENTGLGPAAAVGNATRIRQDGSFTIESVPPGSYRAVASSAMGGGRGGAAAEIEMASLPVSVAGEDMTGVLITTNRGGTVNGRVTVSTDSTSRTLPNGLQITAQAVPADVGPGLGGRLGGGRVGADGLFQLTNLFGTRLLRVNGLGQQWILQSVRADGRDVTDTPIDFGAGATSAGIDIVITNRIGEVTGTVAARDGLTADYSVVIFPEDETKWAFPSRHVRSARPDQQGVFRVRALPPGERYLAVALDYLEDGEASDPAFLATIRARGTSLTLGPGESRSVELKLVER